MVGHLGRCVLVSTAESVHHLPSLEIGGLDLKLIDSAKAPLERVCQIEWLAR